MEGNRIPERVLYTNLERRPRNRWKVEVKEDGIIIRITIIFIIGGEAWKDKVYNREEWKKLL
jgi:hypothetical protein